MTSSCQKSDVRERKGREGETERERGGTQDIDALGREGEKESNAEEKERKGSARGKKKESQVR